MSIVVHCAFVDESCFVFLSTEWASLTGRLKEAVQHSTNLALFVRTIILKLLDMRKKNIYLTLNTERESFWMIFLSTCSTRKLPKIQIL